MTITKTKLRCVECSWSVVLDSRRCMPICQTLKGVVIVCWHWQKGIYTYVGHMHIRMQIHIHIYTVIYPYNPKFKLLHFRRTNLCLSAWQRAQRRSSKHLLKKSHVHIFIVSGDVFFGQKKFSFHYQFGFLVNFWWLKNISSPLFFFVLLVRICWDVEGLQVEGISFEIARPQLQYLAIRCYYISLSIALSSISFSTEYVTSWILWCHWGKGLGMT